MLSSDLSLNRHEVDPARRLGQCRRMKIPRRTA